MDNPSAFDALAAAYDHTFTHTEIGRWLRGRIHARLNAHFRAGQSVLELGCGTGEDALHLAGQGIYVTATDASLKMLEIARQKTQYNSLVRLAQLDLQDLILRPGERSSSAWRVDLTPTEGAQQPLLENEVFDGAFSNFGPLNVLNDWKPVARWLASRVKEGGIVGLGVMGPLCLWEIGWHGMHLNLKTAVRRIKGFSSFQSEGAPKPITIYYPTIQRLEQDFSQWFESTYVESIGLFLPPSDVYGVIEKRPRLMNFLMGMERRFARNESLARFADHYWIEFQRRKA